MRFLHGEAERHSGLCWHEVDVIRFEAPVDGMRENDLPTKLAFLLLLADLRSHWKRLEAALIGPNAIIEDLTEFGRIAAGWS